MRCYISAVCVLSVLVALSSAAPAPQEGSVGFSAAAGLNTTALVSTFNQKIQLLRRLCPQLFQVIDNVVQNITSQLFSVVGRVILRNGLGGGGGGSGGGSVESRVSVVLPTFPPDDDDDDDEDDDDEVVSNNLVESTPKGGDVDVRVIDTGKSSTTSSSGIALSANEIQTEGAPFTGGNILGNRAGEVGKKEETFELFGDDDDCGGEFEGNKPEKLVKTTRTETVDNLELANRNSFVDDSITSTTVTESGNIETTTINSDKNEMSTLDDDLKQNSIDAIFKGIVEVENSEEFKESGETKETDDIASTTTKEIANFDIKVVHNGSIVNTIPLIGDNTISASASIKRRSPVSVSRPRRVVREAAAAEEDQDVAASGGNGPDPADLSDVEADDSERDKRYLPFGGDAHVSAGGGSGNFLFDIIRRTADGAARAAGTVYRMVAGTENLGIGLTATSTATRVVDGSAISQLIAGSGATEESDEKENAIGAGGVAEIDVAKTADGYTEGIPGPITRLFVIANRGLANLVQDLILRLAQTSERIVNFKARLITALI